MADIKKYIETPGTQNLWHTDQQLDLQDWSEAQAHINAKRESIQLTEAHWEVVYYLREHYLEFGSSKNARELNNILNNEFADRGGKKYLRSLFPGGPVTQGMRIAGLPLPPHTEDQGFGTSY